MQTFFLYLMKSVLCLALFYPFYMVLLSRETFHRFNRMALLSILLASVVIPACRITTEEPLLLTQLYQRWENWLTGREDATAAVSFVDWTEMETNAMPMAVEEVLTPASTFSLLDFLNEHWGDLLFMLYIGGILFLLVRHAVSIVRLSALLKKGKMQRLDEDTLLYLHQQKEIAPFSWMKYIVISEADYRENGKQIVAHEQAHISNGHSWDLLLIEVCLLAQWFNPAAWLIRQELQNIHEYEADDTVLRRGINAKEYQLLIIKKAVGARLYSLANSLNHSSLKKRLTMMMKEKSHPWARLKYLYVLPLAAISMVAFAHTEAANNSNGVSGAKGTEVLAIDQTSSQKSTATNQKVKVRCRIVDAETGNPVFGANVVVRGTGRGTVSNKEGRFEIEVLPKTDVIIVSYVGMSSANIKVAEGFDTSIEHTIKLRQIEMTPEMLKEKPANDLSLLKEGDKAYLKLKGDSAEPIFMVVENMPEYPGGTAELMKYLQRNIRYPKEAREKNEQGRVVVQFTIGKDGKLSDFEVKKSVSPALDAEAIRVAKAMPDWKPGRQRGMAVSCRFTVPIQFSLQGVEGGEKAQEGNIREVTYGKGEENTRTEAKGQTKGDEDVFMVVEEMPEYPGGMGELMTFLMKSIKYPEKAMKDSIQGRVIVQFVIDKTGKVINPTIKRSVSPELDAEAIRVVNTMPLWEPGKQKGKAVNVQFTLPIQFKIRKGNSNTDNSPKEAQDMAQDTHTPQIFINKRGEYMYGQEASMKKGTLEEVANYIKGIQKKSSNAGKGADFKVQVTTDKDTPTKHLEELKETLRKLYVLQINYRQRDFTPQK